MKFKHLYRKTIRLEYDSNLIKESVAAAVEASTGYYVWIADSSIELSARKIRGRDSTPDVKNKNILEGVKPLLEISLQKKEEAKRLFNSFEEVVRRDYLSDLKYIEVEKVIVHKESVGIKHSDGWLKIPFDPSKNVKRRDKTPYGKNKRVEWYKTAGAELDSIIEAIRKDISPTYEWYKKGGI